MYEPCLYAGMVCSAGLSECHQSSRQSHPGSSASVHHYADDGLCCVSVSWLAHSICYWVSVSSHCQSQCKHTLLDDIVNAVCQMSVWSWLHCVVTCPDIISVMQHKGLVRCGKVYTSCVTMCIQYSLSHLLLFCIQNTNVCCHQNDSYMEAVWPCSKLVQHSAGTNLHTSFVLLSM